MNEKTRSIIINFYKEGYTVEGIASALNLAPKIVETELSKHNTELKQKSEHDKRKLKYGEYTEKQINKLFKNLKLNKHQKTSIFELRAKGLSDSEIAITLGIPEPIVVYIQDLDKAKIKVDSRARECLELYKSGQSLEDIGQQQNITRERVRQIMQKQFAYDIGFGPLEQKVRKDEIKLRYREIVEFARSERRQEYVDKLYDEAIAKGLAPEYFDSILKFCDAANISPDALKEFKPAAYKIINRNAKIKAQRWNTYYDSCRMCGTTSVKYRSNGYCEKCYSRSPEFKAMQQRSHQKHRDSILAQNKKYYKEYYNRPEIIERIEREYDERHFGGNRKSTLERDGYRCRGCGMSTDVKDKTGRTKVRVWHLKDKNDHALDSLGTYCQRCLFKVKQFNLRRKTL